MGAQGNTAPVIIKRKKIVAAPHHGGAWKVAYADFVTAMMAFFLLMWLLNSTSEQQRKGLADYFTPTITVNRNSGGGDGAFGGDSIFSEDILPKNGTGATAQYSTRTDQSRGDSGMSDSGGEIDQSADALKALQDTLMGRGGESAVMANMLRHIVTRLTDEGLVIELFAHEGVPLFEGDSDVPTDLMRQLVGLVATVSKTVVNNVAVGGHVRARPIVLVDNPVWALSEQRATRVRLLLEEGGLAAGRMFRVTGHADRESVIDNPMAARNDRIEVVLLR